MMIYIYENAYGDSLQFGGDSPYKLTGIENETDVAVALAEASTLVQVGSTVTGEKVESKHISFSGDYKETPENRKNILNVVIPSAGRIKKIEDGATYYIDVYVSSSPDLTKINGVYSGFSFDVLAPFPYWRDLSGSRTDFVEYISNFSFPKKFSPGTPFKISTTLSSRIKNIENLSPIPAGFVATFTARGSVSNPEFTHVEKQEFIRFADLDLIDGDVVEVSTIDGQKYVRLTRGHEAFNIFNKLDDDSSFFTLNRGGNTVQFDAESGNDLLDFSIYFDRVHIGV